MADDVSEVEVHRPDTGPMNRADQRQLKRELATGEVKRSVLARKYGVTASYVTQFAKRYAREIDDIRAELSSELAGLWIAKQEQRIAAYQHEYELAGESKNADHHEWVKARTGILKNVAEELGQIQGKQPMVGVVVQHVIVGVDVDDLK